MKTAILAAILGGLALCSPAAAKHKDVPAQEFKAPVYDLTGTISFESAHSDYQFSGTVDGNTTTLYCSADDHTASCSDSGGTEIVTFAHGSWAVMNHITPVLPVLDILGNPKPTVDDPLMAVLFKNHDGKPAEFKYRIAVLPTLNADKDGNLTHVPAPYFCTPSATQEVCYRIYPENVQKPKQ